MKLFNLRNAIYFVATVGFFSVVQCQENNFSAPNSSEQANSKSLKQVISEGAFLVDVRTPAEFSSGSIEGAVNIPLDEIQDRVHEFQGKKGVVVFCRTGNRSSTAKRILEKQGIPDVYNGINTTYIKNEMKK